MKRQRLNYFFWHSILLTTSVVMFINQPLRVVALPIIASKTPLNNQQLLPRKTITKSVTPVKEISNLNQVEHPLTDAQKLVQSPTSTSQTQVISVIGVKLNSTNKGLEVILETTVDSNKLQVTPKTEGNSYIADIPNAQLRLTSGNTFRQSKPVAGIIEVTVINVDTNTIRLTVTGEAGVPTVELFDSPNKGLVFGVSATAATAIQPTQTTPKPANQEEQKPIELEVIGTPDTGYRVPRTSVGTKTDTQLRDVPQTVQVIPRQLVEDRGANNSGEALRNLGIGAAGFPSRINDADRIIRGFTATSYNTNLFRNGLRDSIAPFALTSSLANIERIEVLRGPASVLYGQGAPSGIINLVTKQPLNNPYYSLQFKAGSYSLYEPSIDLSGSLTSNRNLLYRFNGEYQNSGSFIDFQHTERYFVAPVISWQPGKDTKLTIEADYQNLRQSFFETGLPAAGTVLPNPNGKLPRSLYLGEQKLDQESRELGRISYYFEHKFNENWLLHNAFRFAFARNNSEGNVLPISLLGDNRTLTRRYLVYNQPRVTNTYELDTNVVGKFKTGSLSHQLLAGVDLYSLIDIQNYLLQNLTPINIFNPVYGQYTLGSPSRLNNKTRKGAAGFYLQDQIALTDNLKLVLGGRVDIERNKFTDFINSNNNSDKTDTAFSPRIGIIYQPIQSVSLYASYSRSFEQVGGADINSNPFKPSRGTQYEVGVKTDLLNNKLFATLALYQITKNNITTADPNNTLFNIQVGEQRSRGVELNLIGEILPGWNIIASYNYSDPRITRDNTYKVGNLLNNAPENSAALWTTYTIPSGNWEGFGGGIGVNYVGSRFGDLDNSFRLPDYVTADAAIYYQRGNLSIGLNFKNLFDTLYYEAAFSRTRVYPGAPFEAQFNIKYEF